MQLFLMVQVIDGYDEILKSMEKNKLVKIDGYIVRPLHSPKNRYF